VLLLSGFTEVSVDASVRFLPEALDGVKGHHRGGPAPHLRGRFSETSHQTFGKLEAASSSGLRLEAEYGLIVVGRGGR